MSLERFKSVISGLGTREVAQWLKFLLYICEILSSNLQHWFKRKKSNRHRSTHLNGWDRQTLGSLDEIVSFRSSKRPCLKKKKKKRFEVSGFNMNLPRTHTHTEFGLGRWPPSVKGLAFQAWGPEFALQNPCKKQGEWCVSIIPAVTRMQRQTDPWKLLGQLAWPTLANSPASEKPCAKQKSKALENGHLTYTHVIFSHTNICPHIHMCSQKL